MRYGKYVIGIIGLGLLGLAVFAYQFGLDNNSDWGRGRMLIFGVGIVLVSINALGIVFGDRLANNAGFLKKTFEKLGAIDYSIKLNIFSFLAIITVTAVYVWSFMPFVNSNPPSNNYSQLAIAFKSHQLYLIPLGHLLFSGTILDTIQGAVRNGLPAESWLVLGLLGSTLILLSLILLYYYPAVRFTMEFLPSKGTMDFTLSAPFFSDGRLFRTNPVEMKIILNCKTTADH